MAFDLRLMRYALAVAEEGSFRDAADRLHIAQPALSRAIAQLERDLGVELFSRRPTRLTASGQLFIERARQILADVDTAVTATRLADRGELGVVSVGYDYTAASHPIPELSHELHQRYPGLQVRARELTDADLMSDLTAGNLDVVVGHDLPEAPGTARRVLRYEPVAAVLNVDHPLAGRSQLDLAELHGETYRTAPRHETPRRYDNLMAALDATGATFEVWHNPHPGMRSFSVGRVGGFTLLPLTVGDRLPRGVIAVPLTDTTIHMALEVAWRAHATTPAAALVVETASHLAADHIGDRSDVRPQPNDGNSPSPAPT